MNNRSQKANINLAEFFLVAISCIALSIRPELSWLPLIIASLPWIIRIASPQSSFRLSLFDFLIFLFLSAATIGLLVSHAQEEAFHKFYLIIGALLLLYALSRQPRENLWIITLSLGVFGAITTAIFLLTNNWETFTPDIALANRFNKTFSQVQQFTKFDAVFDPQLFHPNIVGGINALLLPLIAATAIYNWKRNQKILALFSLVIFSILFTGLFLSSSRAAWGATIFGFGVLAFLNFPNQGKALLKNRAILVALPVTIIIIGVTAPFILSKIFTSATIPAIEVTSFESRLQLARQTYFLIADFPFTGGGLASFPGLFSQYILVIPNFMFRYSHNLYLDIALEQGVFGLTIWFFIIFLSALFLEKSIRKARDEGRSILLPSAIYASLIIFLLHGILDDSIYSNSWGLPLLFILPGYALALSDRQKTTSWSTIKNNAPVYLVGFVVVLGLAIFNYNAIFATWYANMGAINMAKIELENWPRGEWISGDQTESFLQVEDFFHKSISYQEFNPTSQYRLGLISMAQVDFNQAANHLEIAHNIFPEHRGVKKNLGYSYTWLGKLEEAQVILQQIPEAKSEMESYIWWWQMQGKNEFAKNAFEMGQRLE